MQPTYLSRTTATQEEAFQPGCPILAKTFEIKAHLVWCTFRFGAERKKRHGLPNLAHVSRTPGHEVFTTMSNRLDWSISTSKLNEFLKSQVEFKCALKRFVTHIEYESQTSTETTYFHLFQGSRVISTPRERFSHSMFSQALLNTTTFLKQFHIHSNQVFDSLLTCQLGRSGKQRWIMPKQVVNELSDQSYSSPGIIGGIGKRA